MADDETKKDETTEETPQDEAPPAEAEQAQDEAPEAAAEAEPEAAQEAEAPAADAGGGSEAEQPSEDDDLPWKVKRRLEKSRRPHEAGPQLSPEERAAKRAEEQKARAGQRSKQRSATRGKKTAAGPGTPPAEREANDAKVRQGIVVSDKGEKSITVRVDIVRRHRVYEKVVRRSRTLHAHDERNEAGEGDVVRVIETRPLSKTKRWRLVDVVEKAK
jgi:small subunit ribosomal protein S17